LRLGECIEHRAFPFPRESIVDPEGDEDYAIHVRIDLSTPLPAGQEEAPLIELVRIGR
jgi:hypothetical protein